MIVPFLKDILFPIECVGCEKEGEWCCAQCLKTITPRTTQECPVCNRENDGVVCSGCKNASSLDRIRALYEYQESGSLGQLIKQLKYQHARETIRIFKQLVIQASAIYNSSFVSSAVIIPVPLHTRRRRERGFNQAELLARIFMKVLKETYSDLSHNNLDMTSLVRSRYTSQQARLSHDERIKNLEQAFVWTGPSVPERVILIDDVFTTGSTLQAAAQTLKQAGVRSVEGLTLARGKMG